MKNYDTAARYAAIATCLSATGLALAIPGIFSPISPFGIPLGHWLAALFILVALAISFTLLCRTRHHNKNYVNDTYANEKSVNINLTFDNMSPEQITALGKLLKDLSPSQLKALFCGQQTIGIERQQKKSS